MRIAIVKDEVYKENYAECDFESVFTTTEITIRPFEGAHQKTSEMVLSREQAEGLANRLNLVLYGVVLDRRA